MDDGFNSWTSPIPSLSNDTSSGRLGLLVDPLRQAAFSTTFPTSDSPGNNSTDADTIIAKPLALEYSDLISIAWIRHLMIAFYVIGAAIAVVGNSLVILVIYRKRSLQNNPTIIFILNLAACDLVCSLVYRVFLIVDFFLPFAGFEDTKYTNLDNCRVLQFFQILFVAVGFHTVVAISQERLLLIVYPLRAKSLYSVSRTKKILVAIWLIAVLCLFPMPAFYAVVLPVTIDGTYVQYCGCSINSPEDFAYFIFIFIFYFFLPSVIITVTYVKIFHALYKRSNQLLTGDRTAGVKNMRVRRQLAKMMLFVALLFTCTAAPSVLYFMVVGSGHNVQANGFFYAAIVDFLPTISSCANPFIYTLSSRTFRSGFRTLVFGKRKGSEDFTKTFNSTRGGSTRPSSLLSSQTGGRDTKVYRFQNRKSRESNDDSTDTFHKDTKLSPPANGSVDLNIEHIMSNSESLHKTSNTRSRNFE